MIQRNLYRCIGILLEGRQRLKEDYLTETRGQSEETDSGIPVVESSVFISLVI